MIYRQNSVASLIGKPKKPLNNGKGKRDSPRVLETRGKYQLNRPRPVVLFLKINVDTNNNSNNKNIKEVTKAKSNIKENKPLQISSMHFKLDVRMYLIIY